MRWRWPGGWRELGFASLWAPEHGIVPAEFSVGAAGARAGAPQRLCRRAHQPDYRPAAVSLGRRRRYPAGAPGTGICLVPERNPIRLAKEVATLDRLSGGRFLFGIGAGWLQGEAEILGADFPRRWQQTGEYVRAMQALWTQPQPEFPGRMGELPAGAVRTQAGAAAPSARC